MEHNVWLDIEHDCKVLRRRKTSRHILTNIRLHSHGHLSCIRQRTGGGRFCIWREGKCLCTSNSGVIGLGLDSKLMFLMTWYLWNYLVWGIRVAPVLISVALALMPVLGGEYNRQIRVIKLYSCNSFLSKIQIIFCFGSLRGVHGNAVTILSSIRMKVLKYSGMRMVKFLLL